MSDREVMDNGLFMIGVAFLLLAGARRAVRPVAFSPPTTPRDESPGGGGDSAAPALPQATGISRQVNAAG